MTRYAPGAPVPSFQPGYGGKPQPGAAYGAAPYNNGGKGGDMGKPMMPQFAPQGPPQPQINPLWAGPQQQPANPYGQFEPGMEAPGNRRMGDPRFAQWQAMMRRQRQGMRPPQQPQQPQPVVDYFNPFPRP